MTRRKGLLDEIPHVRLFRGGDHREDGGREARRRLPSGIVHADDHVARRVHGQVRRVAARVAAGAEDVELGERLPGPRHQDDVGQGAARDDDARGPTASFL